MAARFEVSTRSLVLGVLSSTPHGLTTSAVRAMMPDRNAEDVRSRLVELRKAGVLISPNRMWQIADGAQK